MKTIQIGTKEKNREYGFRETCFGIYVKDNKAYLTKKDNDISLIGGGKEKNETDLECLSREFLEESGCKLKSIKEFCTIDCFWITRTGYHMESLAHFFIVDIDSIIEKPLESESELILIDINEVLASLKLPYQYKAMELFLTEYKNNY